jgi:hypothetical protein
VLNLTEEERAGIFSAELRERRGWGVNGQLEETCHRGNRFEVEEAREIIESGIVPPDRPADGHDIPRTYKVVGSIEDMTAVQGDFNEFIDILTRLHAIIIGRPARQATGAIQREAKLGR